MNSDNHTISHAETLAALYLIAPLFIFFAFFIRVEIAIPACALIAFQVYELVRRTAWRESITLRWEPCYFLALAGLWVWLSGGIGPLHQNVDWLKHYSVVNFLTQNPWPATGRIGNLGDAAIRYSIGWYLVPSLILKITAVQLQNIMLAAWSCLGIFLLFSLLPDLVGNRRAVIAAPLVFIVFGGADIVGTLLTHHKQDLPYHFEWWADWIQFSAHTTSIFWVPQHAIPAWLGVAILMRYRERVAFLPYVVLLVCAILLWSPFSAVGLVPFLAALLGQHGFRKILSDWRPIVSILLLAVPVGLYLVADSGAIPSGFIGTLPCVWDDRACFTWPSYVVFLLIEVGIPLSVLFLRKEPEQGFLAAAAIALCVIPLYKIGIFNDFAMRASLPALAVLSILCAKVLVTGPKRHSAAILLVLLAALPTSIGEMYRGFLPGLEIRPDATFQDVLAAHPQAANFLGQYFAPLPVWVLR